MVANVVDWEGWERLLRERGVVIERPRGSAHPRYPDMIYPLDYGYIPGATGSDGAEVDVFVGASDSGLRAPRWRPPTRSRATASSSCSGT